MRTEDHRLLHGYRRLLLIMRISTVILLSFFFFQVSAEGYSQTVTIKANKLSLFDILKQINKQTGIQFTFSQATALASTPITIELKQVPVREALDRCMADQPLGYRFVDDKTIFIFAKSREGSMKVYEDSTKAKAVTGKVLNERGLPLVGASVQIRNKPKGTQTDIRGEFILSDVAENDLLAVSFTGYTPQLAKIGEKRHFIFELKVAIDDLDKVIVQGYGTTTKRFSTGNIATITAEEIERQPVANPLLAIQGRVPGVVVTQSSGYASAPVTVEIRGRSTLNPLLKPEPLYIIDGVPLTILTLDKANNGYGAPSTGFIQNGFLGPAMGQSPFFSVNPADIESITVLKDADATAIYGSRGGNGVIIITTKNGKPGRTKMEISASLGITSVNRRYEMLNTQQYVEMRREALSNDGLTPSISNAYDLVKWDTTRYTDFQEFYWGSTAQNQEFNIGFSGGDKQTTFKIGLSYFRRTKFNSISGSDQRGSFQFNFQNKSANQKFSVLLSSTGSYGYNNLIALGGSVTALPHSPPVFDAKGKLNYDEWKPITYPFGSLLRPYFSKTLFINTRLRMEYLAWKGLRISASLGISNNYSKQKFVDPLISQDPVNPSKEGSLQLGNNYGMRVIVEPQVNYDRLIGNGNLSFLMGGTYQYTTQDANRVLGVGYESDDVINTLAGAKDIYASDGRGEYKYVAIFTRISYTLLKKYLLNLSGRIDGSSRFGPKRQYGNFGAIGIGWIMSEERFFRGLISMINFAKLRFSYGLVGSDLIGDYGYLTRWSPGSSYQGTVGLAPIQHANPDLQWQSDKKMEIGLELSLINEKVNLGISLYQNRTSQQLLTFILPGITGFRSTMANFPATLQNKGIEMSLNVKLFSRKDFELGLNFNIGRNRNKLISFPNIEQSPYNSIYTVGQSANVQKVLLFTGVDPQTGKYTFADLNHDGQIIGSEGQPGAQDIIYKDLSINYEGGFGTEIQYKSLSLNIQFHFRNTPGYSSFFLLGNNPGTTNNFPVQVLDRWQKPGDIALYARYSTLSTAEDDLVRRSNRTIVNASFVRLNNIAMTYNIPPILSKKFHIAGCQLFIRAQNVALFTKYAGPDPEVQSFGTLPPVTTFTGGMNLNF